MGSAVIRQAASVIVKQREAVVVLAVAFLSAGPIKPANELLRRASWHACAHDRRGPGRERPTPR